MKMKHILLDCIELNKESRVDLANYLDISYQTLSKKLNGHVDFTLTEMRMIKKHYHMSANQIDNTFFNEEDMKDMEESTNAINNL